MFMTWPNSYYSSRVSIYACRELCAAALMTLENGKSQNIVKWIISNVIKSVYKRACHDRSKPFVRWQYFCSFFVFCFLPQIKFVNRCSFMFVSGSSIRFMHHLTNYHDEQYNNNMQNPKFSGCQITCAGPHKHLTKQGARAAHFLFIFSDFCCYCA